MTENGSGVGKHLTFGMFKDKAKCWLISNGELRLLEEREISSEDYMLVMQSKNKVNSPANIFGFDFVVYGEKQNISKALLQFVESVSPTLIFSL